MPKCLDGPAIRAILEQSSLDLNASSGPPHPSIVTRFAKERRQHPRVLASELPILLQEGSDAPLRIRDLSRSGVAFYSETPIAVMTQVRFAIEFPHREAGSTFSEGEGVVVRCERLASALGHYEIAVFFGEVSKDAAMLIQAYVDRNLASEQLG